MKIVILLLCIISMHASILDIQPSYGESWRLGKSNSFRYGYSETLDMASVTGMVCVHNPDPDVRGLVTATGVALDQYTILTAAHIDFPRNKSGVHFILNSNPFSDIRSYTDSRQLYDQPDAFLASEIITHPSYNKRLDLGTPYIFQEQNNYVHTCFYGSRSTKSYPLEEQSNITYEDYMNTDFYKAMKFCDGADLAILKLQKPLPEYLPYPNLDYKEIATQFAWSIGFGDLKFNSQTEGPKLVSTDEALNRQRHVISCKSSYDSERGFWHGDYKGLVVNGDESFIPTKEMEPTAGLPVKSDSGGPLFTENGELLGILSSNQTFYNGVIADKKTREALSQYIQPVFPIWTSIEPHKEWIKKNMVEKI